MNQSKESESDKATQFDPTKPLTLDRVAEILFDAIRPLYKGMPVATGYGYIPEFRKTLTTDELNNLLLTVHNIIAAILVQQKRKVE